jgi:hypothetical protein
LIIPLSAGRGQTFYHWQGSAANSAMLEVYHDICVPIFPRAGNQWPCQFLIKNSTAYLISKDQSTTFAPCCVFEKPFYPPAPTFAHVLSFNGTSSVFGLNNMVDWYVVQGSQPATTFGYGFVTPARPDGTSVPGAFFFGSVGGWAQQNFVDVSVVEPEPSVFTIPDVCIGAPICNWG